MNVFAHGPARYVTARRLGSHTWPPWQTSRCHDRRAKYAASRPVARVAGLYLDLAPNNYFFEEAKKDRYLASAQFTQTTKNNKEKCSTARLYTQKKGEYNDGP